MKKVFLVMLISVLFLAGCGGSKGIPVVGEWAAFTDDSNGGDSTIEMTEVEKDGKTAYRFTGYVNDVYYPWGYTGWEITPDEKTLKALKTAKGLSFKFLGDGQSYIVKYRVRDVQDYAHHEYVFESEKDKEITVEVPINFFMQPPWGEDLGPITDLLENAYSVSWQTHESWRPGSYDITIWDVRIMTK